MGGNCCRKLVVFSLVAADSLEELLVDQERQKHRKVWAGSVKLLD